MLAVEYGLIAALLAIPEKFYLIDGKIKPEYFSDVRAKKIFEAMQSLQDDINLPDIAKKQNLPLLSLMEMQGYWSNPTEGIIKQYAYGVLERYKQREREKVQAEGYDENTKARLAEIDEITLFDEEDTNTSAEFLQNVQDKYEGKPDERIIKTGYYSIDDKIGGFRKSEAVFIGGNAGSGKTAFSINLAHNYVTAGKKVLFCSLEMAKIELLDRLIKHITGVADYTKASADDMQKVIAETKKLDELPLTIYDKAGMTFEDIVRKAKEIQPDIMFIDHLAILRTTKFFKSRYEEVSFLAAKIKQLARELDIPVVCLVQLNRGNVNREVKAPNMADIRDSGQVEENGDLICFVYRPEYLMKQAEPDDKNSNAYLKWESQMEQLKGKASFIVAKNRRGYTGRIPLRFDGPTFTFSEA